MTARAAGSAGRGSSWPTGAEGLEAIYGVGVGHYQKTGRGWLTGCTVIVPPPGTVGSVDVRGGAPGTRETDLLDPRMMIDHVDAVCLSGGSAYGLAAADGVMTVLEAHGIGHPVGPSPFPSPSGARHLPVVPIVPAAVIFDLGRGGHLGHRPDAVFGARAATIALRRSLRRPPTSATADTVSVRSVASGSLGAGAGARAGGLRGGIGSAALVLPSGVQVAALAVVNAAGSTVDRTTGTLFGAVHLPPVARRGLHPPSRADVRRAEKFFASEVVTTGNSARNTTLVVLATSAALTKAECHKLAGAGHDGMARAISPVHLQVDGDVVFSLATGADDLDAGTAAGHERSTAIAPGRALAFDVLLAAAADVVTQAVVDAMLTASGIPTMPSYLDLYPSAAAPSVNGARG